MRRRNQALHAAALPMLAGREAIWIWIVAILAFGLRAIPLLRSGSDWAVATDSHRYLALAHGLANGCGFSPWLNENCGSVELLRTPGYPAFIAVVGESPREIVALQGLMGAAVCLIAGLFLKRRFGVRAGLLAALLIAFDLDTIAASKEVLTDQPFQFILVAGVLCAVSAAESRGALLALGAGLLVGIASLIRPVGEFAIPLLALPFLLEHSGKRLPLVAIAGALVIVGPWLIRNFKATGMMTLTTEGPMNLYSYTVPAVLSRHDGTDLLATQRKLVSAIAPAIQAKLDKPHDELVWMVQTEPQISREMLRRSIQVFLAYPVDTAAVILTGFLKLSLVPRIPDLGLMSVLGSRQRVFGLLRTSMVVFDAALLAVIWLGIGKAIFSIRQWPQARVAAFVTCLGFALATLFAAAPFLTDNFDTRFRVPAIAFLAMAASIGWFQSEPQ